MSEENLTNGAGAPEEAQNQPQFALHRIYCKDISFETPNSPTIFQKEWKPEIKLDIDTRSTKLDDINFEIVLTITVTAKVEDTTAFLCEVQQAGIFTIEGMPEQQLPHMLGSYCPNMLFPYARETISNLVNRGTFPPLNLAPVNFDAIFNAYMQKRQQEEQGNQQQLDA